MSQKAHVPPGGIASSAIALAILVEVQIVGHDDPGGINWAQT